MGNIMTGKRYSNNASWKMDSGATSVYSKAIGGEEYAPLTEGEEIHLAIKMRQGDNNARDEFYKRNLRLAMTIAAQMHGNVAENLSSANVGLALAVDKFDPSRNVKFSTFAAFWIKQQVMKDQAENKTVKIPVASLVKCRKVKSLVEQGMTDDQIAEALNLSRKVVRHYRLTETGSISIDTPIGDDGETTVANFVPCNDSKQGEISEHVQHILKNLSEREQKILLARFGIGQEKKRLEDLAQEFSLTREAIRQIEMKALQQLKKIA
jgi:RNA polymerase primary sigma factor